MGREATMRGRVSRQAVPLLGMLLIVGAEARPARAADLMDLYAKARASDPTVLSARSEQLIADQSLREAKSGYKPTLSANGQATRVYQDIVQSDNFLYAKGQTDYFNKNY